MLCNKKCKEAGKCIYSICPYDNLNKIRNELMSKSNFVGPLSDVFIGSFNYPNVNMSVLANFDEENENKTSVEDWVENKLSINDIILQRSSIINNSKINTVNINKQSQSKLSKFSLKKPLTNKQQIDTNKTILNNSFIQNNSFDSINIKNKDFIDDFQLLSLSKKQVDGEIEYLNKVQNNMSFDNFVKPMGPKVNLRSFSINQNIHIPTMVDKTIDDELKADESLEKLYKKNFDIYYLNKIFSAGTLGLNKKIVPTKWSITAVDDTISKKNIEKVRNYEIGNETLIYSNDYMGNYYIILMQPEQWAYEFSEFNINDVINLFESHLRKPRLIKLKYLSDYEGYLGRKNYAINTAGAYYAAKLSLSEKLIELKKQYKICIMRFISDEYYSPLGVWIIREGIKMTLKNKPISFENEELAKQYIKSVTKKKYRIEIDEYINQSKYFNNKVTQKSLFNY